MKLASSKLLNFSPTGTVVAKVQHRLARAVKSLENQERLERIAVRVTDIEADDDRPEA